MNCTPGPFHIIGVRPPYTIHAKLPNGSDTDALATVHHEGNQQLFAAVHDLLAACEAVEQAQLGGDYEHAFNLIHAALSKARGK